jgi:amidase
MGEKKFDTGGSSSGSASSIAANQQQQWELKLRDPFFLLQVQIYCGSEANNWFAKRSGIVPLSSTLDTPGPMTKRYRQPY